MKPNCIHFRISPCLAALLGVTSALAAGPICFEAEKATTVQAPVTLASGSDKAEPGAAWQPAKGASGDQYIEVAQGKGNPPDVTGGQATFHFKTPTKGSYYLWMRAWWGDECSNSLSVSIDDAGEFAFGQDGTFKRWHWVKAPPRLKQLNLTPGEHTLTLKNREDGVRIDQILLTTDRRYIPVEKEPVTFTPAQPDTAKQP